MSELPLLKFDNQGLIPVIAQDADTGEVLMFAYATKEALEKTLSSKQAHYWSRSRNELWHKGARL
jgi:phosphoribosyl-AMP cyclohydrolase